MLEDCGKMAEEPIWGVGQFGVVGSSCEVVGWKNFGSYGVGWKN